MRLGWGVTIIILAALLVFGSTSHAAPATVVLPEYKGWVNDFAGVLSAEEKAQLEDILKNLESKTTAEITVVTVKTTKPIEPKMYAVALMEKWGVGKSGKDNGVIILAAIEERRVEVEVGYGLESILTDSITGRILDNDLIPHFRQDKYGAGLIAAARSMAAIVGGQSTTPGAAPLPPQQAPGKSTSSGELAGFAAAGMVLLGVLVLMLALRSSLGRKCPKCKSRLIVNDRVVTPATALAAGLAMKRYFCSKCGYCDETPYRIPPIVVVRRHYGGGGFFGGGSGGFRGGGSGFGGFGGGRSGGGGAGRSW